MKPIARGSGRSSVAASAYRAAVQLLNERDGMVHDFTRRSGVEHAEIVLPEGVSAEWARDRSALWNAAEAAERRKDARVAREFELALPAELSAEQREALTRAFAQDLADRYGAAVDFAIHAPHEAGDVRNHHAHLLMTTRAIVPDGQGLGAKTYIERNNEWLLANNLPTSQMQLHAIRQMWEQHANRHLALAGCDARIDHRSHADRGLELEPTAHMGVHATQMQRRGLDVTRARLDEEAARKNAASIRSRPEQVLKIISGEKSTFDRRDVARVLHRYINDDLAEFQNAFATVMASQELVELRGQIADPETGVVLTEPVYSTREVVRLEQDMADAADRLAERNGFAVRARVVAEAVRSVETKNPGRPFKFDPEQVAAVEHVTAASGIAAVVGFAGAGKSTLLEAANRAWIAEGRKVYGAALAGKAAEGLEESAGIFSRTLASWELGWKNGRDLLQKGDVLVIDEAGMVASGQLSRVLQVVEQAGAKAVLVGDAMQLQPIEAGAAFRAITERVGYVELAGIRRQRDEWAQEASRQFARGQVTEALEAYRSRGHVVEASDKDSARSAIVADWAVARNELVAQAAVSGKALKGDELLVLAHTNADVFGLNAGIRDVMKADGALNGGRDFVTERGNREFAAGDRIIFLRNEKFEEQLAPELGRQQVKNGMLGTVTATAGPDGEDLLRVRLDSGREVAFSPETYRNVDHGYAATVHKSQGVTVDRVFVMASKSMDQHLSYVAMSRHRHQVTMYAPQSEFKDFDALAKTLGRSGAKSTTLDYADRASVDQFAERRGIETLASIAPHFTAFIERQKEWIAEKREQVAELWNRAEQAIGLTRGHVAEQTVASDAERITDAKITDKVHDAPKEALKEAPAPLFAVVTSFAETVEEAARARTAEDRGYRSQIDELTASAAKIWREPAAAVAKIERTIVADNDSGGKLEAALREDPGRAGALRGSDRLMDRFSAAGAERKAALSELPHALAAVRQAEGIYHNVLKAEITREQGARTRMAVEVPGLSDQARNALDQLTELRGQDRERLQRALPREVKDEFAAVNAALDKRFGYRAFVNASDSSIKEMARHVAPGQRETLDKLHTQMKTLQQSVHDDIAQRHQVQRLEKSLNRGSTIGL